MKALNVKFTKEPRQSRQEDQRSKFLSEMNAGDDLPVNFRDQCLWTFFSGPGLWHASLGTLTGSPIDSWTSCWARVDVIRILIPILRSMLDLFEESSSWILC